MKRYLSSMIMAAFVFIAVLPLMASAGEEGKEKKEDKAWINCVDEGGETFVSLHLPGASKKRIATFRLKLYVNEEPEVVFTDEAKKRARVCESRYNSDTHILSIYVSASRSSVDYPVFKNDSLAVCKLSVADSEGNPVSTGAKLADLEDAFRIVQDKEAVNVELEERAKAEDQDTAKEGEDQAQDHAGNPKEQSGHAVMPYIAATAAGVSIVIAAVGYRRHRMKKQD